MPAQVLIPGEGISCNTCGGFAEFKVCKSNAKGNQGRIMASCYRVNSLTGVECSFFRWKRGSTRSPTASPTLANTPALASSPPSTQPFPSTQVPPPTQPSSSTQLRNGNAQMPLPRVCPTRGCNQTRIHVECERRLCKKHCVAAGGCGAHGRARGPAPLRPSATPALGAPHTSPTEDLPDEPLSQAPPLTQNPIATSIDPRPNPRYVSHMPAIFTEQYQREQELQEETRRLEAQRQQHAKISKHSIIVYAWAIDNEPPTIQEFQKGFTWPYFILNPSVLSDLELSPPLIIQQYRPRLGTWLNVKVEHVITVSEGEHIFLRRPTFSQNFKTRWLMCAQDDWRAEDGVFEKEKFFAIVVSLFDDDIEDAWCVETLAWWNERVFKPPLAPILVAQTGPSDYAKLRVQRLAQKAKVAGRSCALNTAKDSSPPPSSPPRSSPPCSSPPRSSPPRSSPPSDPTPVFVPARHSRKSPSPVASGSQLPHPRHRYPASRQVLDSDDDSVLSPPPASPPPASPPQKPKGKKAKVKAPTAATAKKGKQKARS